MAVKAVTNKKPKTIKTVNNYVIPKNKEYEIIITDNKVKRLSDDKELTIIIPNEELGYYNSLRHLQALGYDAFDYICESSINIKSELYERIT